MPPKCETPGCDRPATVTVCSFPFGVHRYCDLHAVRPVLPAA